MVDKDFNNNIPSNILSDIKVIIAKKSMTLKMLLERSLSLMYSYFMVNVNKIYNLTELAR